MPYRDEDGFTRIAASELRTGDEIIMGGPLEPPTVRTVATAQQDPSDLYRRKTLLTFTDGTDRATDGFSDYIMACPKARAAHRL